MGKAWQLCRLDVDIVVLLWEVTDGLRGRVRYKLARADFVVFRCGLLGSVMCALKDVAPAEIYRGWLGAGD